MSTYTRRTANANGARGTTQEFEIFFNDAEAKHGYNDTTNTFIPLASGGGADIPYGVATGTDTYVVTVVPDPSGTHPLLNIKFTNANTGPATIAVNGDAAANIVGAGGTPLEADDIKAGTIYELVKDGAVYQLLNEIDMVAGGILSRSHAQLATAKTGSLLIRGQWYFDTTDQVYLFAVEINQFSINAILKISSSVTNLITYNFDGGTLALRVTSQTDNLGNYSDTSPQSGPFLFNVAGTTRNKITGSLDNSANTGSIDSNVVDGSSSFNCATNSGIIAINKISVGATVSLMLQSGVFSGNTIQGSDDGSSGAQLISTSNQGNVTYNNINLSENSTYTLIMNTAINFRSNTILSPNLGAITFLPTKEEIHNVLEPGSSTFEASGSFALVEANYNAGTKTLTIPAGYNYFGVIELNLNTGREIENIIGMQSNHPVKFKCVAAKTVIFVPTAIGSIAANKVALEAGSNLTLTGRTEGSDYLILRNDGTFSRQTEASILV